MSIVAWILLGVVAGVVANQLSSKQGVGLVSDALLGIAGATVAGFAYDMLGGREEGFGLLRLCLPLVGAGVVLAVSRGLVGRRRAWDPDRTQRAKRARR